MTEEQARERWCPMVRHTAGNDENAAFNRNTEWPKVNLNCVASECMAWRWTDAARGYCGLVGKP